MSFTVMVKDGQGFKLQASGLKNALKQATRALGCKKADLHYISISTADGESFDVYFFDSRAADQAYWLAALKPTTAVLSAGQVPQ